VRVSAAGRESKHTRNVAYYHCKLGRSIARSIAYEVHNRALVRGHSPHVERAPSAPCQQRTRCARSSQIRIRSLWAHSVHLYQLAFILSVRHELRSWFHRIKRYLQHLWPLRTARAQRVASSPYPPPRRPRLAFCLAAEYSPASGLRILHENPAPRALRHASSIDGEHLLSFYSTYI
jgi:hypothetical protein